METLKFNVTDRWCKHIPLQGFIQRDSSFKQFYAFYKRPNETCIKKVLREATSSKLIRDVRCSRIKKGTQSCLAKKSSDFSCELCGRNQLIVQRILETSSVKEKRVEKQLQKGNLY